MMGETIVLIGFGEAGQSIGGGLAGEAGVTVAAYDVRFCGSDAPVLMAKAREAGVAPHAELARALDSASIVLSAVVGSAAVEAGRAAAAHLTAGQTYIDLNSVSPATKRAVEQAVAPSGAHFIEAAVMARVSPYAHRVPILLAGAEAEPIAKRLNAIGMKTEAVGDRVGQASANKMLRSILIKGIEALLIECLVAARRCGIEERILDSVAETFPGIDWRQTATYHLGRTAIHGARRVTEMQEVAQTLRELELEPLLADAIAQRIGWAFERLRDTQWKGGEPGDYREILDAIERHTRFPSPLAGEGGELRAQASNAPGEGLLVTDPSPASRTSSARHPLPQGERGKRASSDSQ
jgi:3-hydroxyisobutyrate dehydrogenase-like beta-hydroxyacid dehydrogenase